MNKLNAEQLINTDENIKVFKESRTGKIEEHIHDFFEMVYIWKGSGSQLINGKGFYVERGDFLFFNIGDRHSVSSTEEIGVVNILINPEFISNELINSQNAIDILALTSFNEFKYTDGFLPKTSFKGKDLIEVETIIDYIVEEFSHKSTGYRTVLKGYVSVLITRILRNICEISKVDANSSLLNMAPGILDYIEANFNKKITIEELAKQCFYNPAYFSKIFKDCFQKTWTEYINSRRINEAIKLLENTDYPVEQICCTVGYKCKNQFYSLFKQSTGMTPGQYRKISKKVYDSVKITY